MELKDLAQLLIHLIPPWHYLLIISLFIIYIIFKKANYTRLTKISLTCLIAALIFTPISNNIVKEKLTVVVLHRGNSLQNAEVFSVDSGVSQQTDHRGRAVFMVDRNVIEHIFHIRKEGYQAATIATSKSTVQLSLKSKLSRVEFKEPQNTMDTTTLEFIPIKATFYTTENKECWVEKPSENISVTLDYKMMKIDFRDSAEVCSITHCEHYKDSEIALGEHEVVISVTPFPKFKRGFVLYKSFGLNERNKSNLNFRDNLFNFDSNGVDLYFSSRGKSSIVWLPFHFLINKPATVIFSCVFFRKHASLMLCLGEMYRILVGEGDLRTIKLERNRNITYPPKWKTISKSRLEQPISLNSTIYMKFYYSPKTNTDSKLDNAPTMKVQLIYYTDSDTKEAISSEVALAFDTPPMNIFGRRPVKLGLGGVALINAKEKCFRLSELYFSNGRL